MNIRALIRNVAAKVCMASVCLLAMSSCDNWLYEEEGDCSVYYRLKFRYDMNLKWADAFANEVTSIHLYAFDNSGRVGMAESGTDCSGNSGKLFDAARPACR